MARGTGPWRGKTVQRFVFCLRGVGCYIHSLIGGYERSG
ncbi:hypothetical protein SLEP1_g54593 [Rubroshorea leprosula]|uniref:Uncharacterized protein n=1 Tax=Rubroshorea leprosula TaxID=152421 RepID=A0AAV5MCY5_9ROSI|nr:hypothetical protein SLEP1_g54593 [Rubroshorea leprosula]